MTTDTLTPAALAVLYRTQLARFERLWRQHRAELNPAGQQMLLDLIRRRRRDLLALEVEA